MTAAWNGPLPPPQHLQAYSQVFPGCAERIVAMAEAESRHRQQEERAETEHRRLLIQAEINSERRGMWLAFVLAVLIVGLSAFLFYVGQLAWGVGLVTVELISLVALFIYGRNSQRLQSSPEPTEDLQARLPFTG